MRHRFRSLLPAALAALAIAASAAPALGSPAPAPGAEARALAEARAARGRWCPIAGCPPQGGASFASLGSFAAATLGALALARRRRS